MAGVLHTVTAARFVPTVAGGAYQVPDQVSLVIIDNAATVGSFSPFVINMPLNPVHNQIVKFTATAMISGITVSANAPRSVANAFNTIWTANSNGGISSMFFAGGLNTWYGVP
jgi:hypothetical protein